MTFHGFVGFDEVFIYIFAFSPCYSCMCFIRFTWFAYFLLFEISMSFLSKFTYQLYCAPSVDLLYLLAYGRLRIFMND